MGFGVMFHHFTAERHPWRPGAITEDELDVLLRHLRQNFSILQPEEFFDKACSNSLDSRETVLTFDDSLLSQFEVAEPVLTAHSLKGIFFVYSSVFTGDPDPLEVFALFRAQAFADFEQFWRAFLSYAEESLPGIIKRLDGAFPGAHWLSEYPFYSINERKFRFLRDKLLTSEQYREIMFRLIAASKSFSIEAAVEGMWMTPKDLSELVSGGHSVGLHSHSHPTAMADLSYGEQLEEYMSNKSWIEGTLGLSPKWVAHPCGSYSETTLRVLQELDVRVGFRDSLTPGPFGTLLEIPREDHTNLMSTFAGS